MQFQCRLEMITSLRLTKYVCMLVCLYCDWLIANWHA